MTDKKQRCVGKKKRYWIPAVAIGILMALRCLLPGIVKNYVNVVLADIPGCYVEVSDIDIWLLRGTYIIDSLYLNKVDAGSNIPFLNFEKIDISLITKKKKLWTLILTIGQKH